MSTTTNTTRMASFLLLVVAMTMLLAVDSARFQPLPAFNNKPTTSNMALSGVTSFEHAKMLSFRGGAKDDDEEAEEDEDENDDEAEAEEDEEDDETDGDASEDEYYDDEEESEEEEEEEESSLASGLKKKSKSKTPSGEIVEPYFVSPSLQMYTTFGTILLSRKVDMFNPTVVRLCRTLFVLYLLVQQGFIFYVRIMAKRNNDRTPVQTQNPLGNMLSKQLENQQAGGNDMVKNLASSFLKTESTVAEYDMGQATNMQGGILFNMAFMWFLHFKLQQVQPLLVTSINGFLQLVYNPLFQVYVLGRNLERPFKSPEVFKDPRAAAEETTTEEGEAETKDDDEEEEEESSDDDEEEEEEDGSDDDEDDGDDSNEDEESE